MDGVYAWTECMHGRSVGMDRCFASSSLGSHLICLFEIPPFFCQVGIILLNLMCVINSENMNISQFVFTLRHGQRVCSIGTLQLMHEGE